MKAAVKMLWELREFLLVCMMSAQESDKDRTQLMSPAKSKWLIGAHLSEHVLVSP